jgi:hypothetical protein
LGKYQITRRLALAGAASGLACVLVAPGCRHEVGEARTRITPEYDENTGKLRLLKYDANDNGKIDTWSYMDGARVIRIEIDSNEDGKIDRWEYYGADQHLEKVGFSRASDGKEDAWSFTAPDGAIERIEVSTRSDGKVNRIEHYQQGRLASAEEDGDGDGATDKWETYDGDRLAVVAFDTSHRGRPDRRLIYRTDGSAQIEVDANGDGHFVVATASTSAAGTPQSAISPKPEPRNPK